MYSGEHLREESFKVKVLEVDWRDLGVSPSKDVFPAVWLCPPILRGAHAENLLRCGFERFLAGAAVPVANPFNDANRDVIFPAAVKNAPLYPRTFLGNLPKIRRPENGIIGASKSYRLDEG
jgi:hypothetical protein